MSLLSMNIREETRNWIEYQLTGVHVKPLYEDHSPVTWQQVLRYYFLTYGKFARLKLPLSG